jgi:hypothetical protein
VTGTKGVEFVVIGAIPAVFFYMIDFSEECGAAYFIGEGSP